MFKSTDSLSRKRTRTCEGTTTRSISDTITSAPRAELTIRESTAKSSTPVNAALLSILQAIRKVGYTWTRNGLVTEGRKPRLGVCNLHKEPAADKGPRGT